jgi:hypothetical protein
MISYGDRLVLINLVLEMKKWYAVFALEMKKWYPMFEGSRTLRGVRRLCEASEQVQGQQLQRVQE